MTVKDKNKEEKSEILEDFDSLDHLNNTHQHTAKEGHSRQKKQHASVKPHASLWAIFKILLHTLWRVWSKYIHSEHPNLRLFARMFFQTVVMFSLLVMSAPYVENYIAPSLKLISSLQMDVKKLQELNREAFSYKEEVSRDIKHTKEMLQNEVKHLKGEITALNAKLRVIETNSLVPTPQAALTPMSPGFDSLQSTVLTPQYLDLKSAYFGVKEKIERGDSFEKEVKALQFFAQGNMILLKAVKELMPFSNASSKPAELLSKELALLKARLIFAPNQENLNLIERVWYRLKQVVQWQSPEDTAILLPSVPPAAKAGFINDIEVAIALLAESKISDAVALFKKTHPKMLDLLGEWLEDAQHRSLLVEKMTYFDSIISPFFMDKKLSQ